MSRNLQGEGQFMYHRYSGPHRLPTFKRNSYPLDSLIVPMLQLHPPRVIDDVQLS